MLSIIVLSSDGYSDCWVPYFTLLKRNFKGVNNHEIILSSNTKTFDFQGLDIKMLTHGKDAAWSKRLKNCLKEASNDIVMVMAEDMFLRSPIDTEQLKAYIQLMLENEEIDHIRLLSARDRTKTRHSKFDGLEEIEARTKLRFLYLPGLWKKNILTKYVMNFESPFISERLGDPRSWIYNHGFFAIPEPKDDRVPRNFYDCQHSGALFKGKWENWTQRYFKEDSMGIDFEKRGLVTPEFAKKNKNGFKATNAHESYCHLSLVHEYRTTLFKGQNF